TASCPQRWHLGAGPQAPEPGREAAGPACGARGA
ncbi:immunoglobulin lambda-like polypeptide 5 isoform 2, partial [Daubentonia madagascariensis]